MDMARVPVVGAWAPEQRRKASLGSTIAAAALVGFAILAWVLGFAGTGVDTFLLFVLVLIILVLVFQALVVVTGIGQGSAASAGGQAAWATEEGAWAPPAGAPAAAGQEPITLKCGSCGTVFDVPDTGERPLRHTCPGCGAAGQLTAEDLGAPVAPASTSPAAQAITLKCGSCGTVFDVPDTGERPLRHTCPGCGSEGLLREEDLGAAPAATGVGPASAAILAALSPAERRQPIEATEGVGAGYGRKLRGAGVTTLGDFLQRHPDDVARASGIQESLVRKWHAMGQLQAINGIGPQYSELLYRAGITGIADLAAQDPDDLLQRIERYEASLDATVTRGVVTAAMAGDWVTQAKALVAPPARAPAPAPPAAAPAAARPGPKTVRTLKLRCKSCSTVFTLRDTGERPLYHECPGCKATGVLR